MKIKIENYTFDASAKTVTLTDYPALRLDSILLITNVTDNVIIYNFADPSLGGTVSGDTLTLDYDTATMSDTDNLLIYIDDLDAVQLVGSSTLATSANQQTDALTDAELRATAVPISGEVSLDLTGTDFATQTTLASIDSNINAINSDSYSINNKLTDGSQTSQIVNSTGDAVTVTGNKLDVNASIDTTGLALETKQDDLITAIGALPQDQALTDTQLRATAVEVSATALDVRPLVNTDVVTAELSATDNAVLDSIETDTSAVAGTVKSSVAVDTDTAINIQTKPVDRFKWSFAKIVSGNIDTDFGTLIKTGSGMAVNQTAGNLVITTGTTAYSETIIRSVSSFKGAGVVRWGLTLSQRIANNNFVVEWVDIVGDDLTLTINSATSITVEKVAHGFTASDVGKGIWIGNISVASCLPQRVVIASIADDDNINLTVAGFPASGSGTCSLFGYNYHQVIYSGTTATALGTGYVSQRLGWANAAVNATINTTASGHIGIIETSRNNDAQFLDQVQASGTSVQATSRASANANVPDIETPLYLQIRAFNGTTNPASTTTATFGFIDAQMYNPLMVNVSGIQPIGAKNTIPVVQQGTVTVSGTVTSTIAAGATTIAKAEDAAHANGDVGVPALSVRSDTAASLAGATNDYQPLITNSTGKLWTTALTDTELRATPVPVSGTITETNSNAIKTAVETIDNAISGSEMQVDVVTLPSIPAGTNNIGDVDVLTLPALSSGTNAIGKLLPPDVDVSTHTNYAKKFYTNTGAVTDGIVWSPASGKRWHIVSMIINVSADATVTLEDDLAAGDSVVWQGELSAKSGFTVNFSEMYPLASGEDAADLLVTTTAGNIYLTITGYEI